MVEISAIIGLGYLFFTIAGKFSLNPLKQYYNKLLENKHFYMNLLVAIVLTIFGCWRVYIDKREVFYFLPLIYLLTLRLLNWVSLVLNKRNIIIITRWDNSKEIKGGISWIDMLLSFLVIFIPIIACGLIMNSIDSNIYYLLTH